MTIETTPENLRDALRFLLEAKGRETLLSLIDELDPPPAGSLTAYTCGQIDALTYLTNSGAIITPEALEFCQHFNLPTAAELRAAGYADAAALMQILQDSNTEQPIGEPS